MKDAKDVLAQLLEQNPVIAQQLQAPQANIYGLWPQVLHNLDLGTLAQHSWVIELEQGRLRLAVRHSVFTQELSMSKGLWLPALEAALRQAGHPQPRIRKVIFRVQSPEDPLSR